MGRAGRYTLAVMAWVAAYAGWSSIIGLVVAAVTGDRPRTVSPAASAAFTLLGPLVPTLVALWFNDWARDGFPTREQRKAAAARAAVQAAPVEPVATEPAPRAPEPVAPRPVAPAPVASAPVPAAPAAVVPAHPLGVPEAAGAAPAGGGFPVAPLLRDRGDLD
jgi:hypothetical protein